MKRTSLLFIKTLFLVVTMMWTFPFSGNSQSDVTSEDLTVSVKPDVNDTLVILWTSGDRDVALKMVFIYAYNAKKYKWWDEIVFIIWGPCAKLLSEDKEVQDYLQKMKDEGIIIKACKWCSDSYNCSAKLEELGVTVVYMGKELTYYLKGDFKVMTF